MRTEPTIRRFCLDHSAVAATEFALLLPLLLLFYMVLFEVGRGWLAQRRFHSTIENAARYAARFPEFDAMVREGLPTVVKRTLAPLKAEELNMSLVSVVLDQTLPEVQFEYSVFGNTPDVDWKDVVTNGIFHQGEYVIIVVGKYTYKPVIFTSFVGSVTFKDAIAFTPFFSRSYKYQSENSRWDYFNVQ